MHYMITSSPFILYNFDSLSVCFQIPPHLRKIWVFGFCVVPSYLYRNVCVSHYYSAGVGTKPWQIHYFRISSRQNNANCSSLGDSHQQITLPWISNFQEENKYGKMRLVVCEVSEVKCFGQIELFPFLLRFLPIVKDIKGLHYFWLSNQLQNLHTLITKQCIKGKSSLTKFNRTDNEEKKCNVFYTKPRFFVN